MAQQDNLKLRIESAILQNDSVSARKLYYHIKKLVDSGEIMEEAKVKALDKVSAQLALVSLNFQSDHSINGILENHPYSVAHTLDRNDLINKFRARLDHEGFLGDRDELRQSFAKSLARSQEEIGKAEIPLGETKVKPTVENWIKVFVTDIGTGDVTNVALARFYSKNKSFQGLSKTEKEVLKNIIDLYNFLKLDSDDPEALATFELIEGKNNNIFQIADGEVFELYDEIYLRESRELARAGTLPPGELMTLRARFPKMFGEFAVPVKLPDTSTLTPEAIQRMRDELLAKMAERYPVSKFEGNIPPTLEGQINDVINLPGTKLKENIEQVQHILTAIASNTDQLGKFLSDDAINKLIIDQLPEMSEKDAKAQVKKNPFSSIALQGLLQIVFNKEFELSNEETLWRSYLIINQVPAKLKSLKTVVSYDISKNKLAWRY